MDYNSENCIVFSNEEKFIAFLKNKIVEIEMKNYYDFNINLKNYKDIKNIGNSLSKSVGHLLKYNLDVIIFKHFIISTSSLNEQHILLAWKTKSNYGFIENEGMDESNLIFKIDFRTIMKNNKLLMRFEWFEFNELCLDTDYYNKNISDSAMQYIFNYASYLKINSIKVDIDGIITEGHVEKYLKEKISIPSFNKKYENKETQTCLNNEEKYIQTEIENDINLDDINYNINANNSDTYEEQKQNEISESDIYKDEINYKKVFQVSNDSESDDEFIMIIPTLNVFPEDEN